MPRARSGPRKPAAPPAAAVAAARARRERVLQYIGEHHPQVHRAGFVEYEAPAPSRIAVVCMTGRGATPADPSSGLHQAAAHAAMHGCRAVIASAHGRSRRRALDWLLARIGEGCGRTIVLGHSHGGDHASALAAESYRQTGTRLAVLGTIDPVNSPGPWPLVRVADPAAAEQHFNWYQRNAPWFGGSIATADANLDVSDPAAWPCWSALLVNSAAAGRGISHGSIDEDLFLAGELSRWWE